MLALIKIVSSLTLIKLILSYFTSCVIIKEHQLSSDSVLKVSPPHEGIGTEHYLIVFRNEYTLIKIVTHNELNVVSLQYNVVLEQSVGHNFPHFVVSNIVF